MMTYVLKQYTHTDRVLENTEYKHMTVLPIEGTAYRRKLQWWSHKNH